MTTTTFNAFDVFIAAADRITNLHDALDAALAERSEAYWQFKRHMVDDGYSVEESNAYLMAALAAERKVKELEQAIAAPVDETEFADPDPVGDLRYTN